MTRKTYPLEFKLDAVALARENGAQMAQVARDLGLAKTTLLNWVRKAEKDDIPRPSLRQTCRSCGNYAGATSYWSKKPKSCGGRWDTSLGRSTQNDVPAGP